MLFASSFIPWDWSWLSDTVSSASSFFDRFMDWITWLYEWLKFLINAVILILNSIWRFFLAIFDDWFFSTITDIFTYMSAYIGTTYTVLFMALFGFVFIYLILSFILRLIRWRVSYDASLKKYHKYHPDK